MGKERDSFLNHKTEKECFAVRCEIGFSEREKERERERERER